MNILFCLTPKSDVDHVVEDASLYKTIQIFDRHSFNIIPVINKKGRYIGVISCGDILGCIRENFDMSVKEAADFPVKNIKRTREYKAVNGSSTTMEEIVVVAFEQSFVPVVDDEYNFIGIITRKSIINWMHETYHKEHPEENKLNLGGN